MKTQSHIQLTSITENGNEEFIFKLRAPVSKSVSWLAAWKLI